MEFTEMKMIWDSQNEEPLYAMNEAALHAIVQRKNQEWNRCLARCFAVEIGVGLACGLLMFVCAGVLAYGDLSSPFVQEWVRITPTPWDILGFVVAGLIWVYYAAYMYGSRRRQQRRVEVFDSTLRGDLDQALSQTDFQIAMMRDVTWLGLVPVWVATTVWVVILLHLKAAAFSYHYLLLGALMIGALILVLFRNRKKISERFEPRRRDLESLRAKLVDPVR